MDGEHIAVDTVVKTLRWRKVIRRAESLCRAAAYIAVRKGMENVLPPYVKKVELTVVLANDAVVQTLNLNYRGQDKTTNVLAFANLDIPTFLCPPGEILALGDVVIALQTVVREAWQHDMPISDYLQYLVVHGTLHLLGYDHQDKSTAEAMEYLEIQALAHLGISDPYYDAWPATLQS